MHWLQVQLRCLKAIIWNDISSWLFYSYTFSSIVPFVTLEFYAPSSIFRLRCSSKTLYWTCRWSKIQVYKGIRHWKSWYWECSHHPIIMVLLYGDNVMLVTITLKDSQMLLSILDKFCMYSKLRIALKQRVCLWRLKIRIINIALCTIISHLKQ